MADVLAQHEIVVQTVLDLIKRGEFGPGDRLPVEADLAERLNVSRGSLREGIRALVAMGILETRQGSGTTVTSLDPALILRPLVFWADIQAGPGALHLHTVRRALEVESARLAASVITDEQLDSLGAILVRAAGHIGNQDHEGAMQADLDFHLTIARATQNPVLSALIEAVSQPTIRSRMWQSIHAAGRLQAAHTEHLVIIEALRSHDPMSARAAMVVHLMQSVQHTPTLPFI